MGPLLLPLLVSQTQVLYLLGEKHHMITVGLWNILHLEGSTLSSQRFISKLMPQLLLQEVFSALVGFQLLEGAVHARPEDPIIMCPLLYLFAINWVGILVLRDVMWDPILANQDAVNPWIVMLTKACSLKRQTHTWNICQPQSG